jgi:shikimate dehydrogenase
LLAEARFCAVIGFPVAHSKSPLIHRYFAEQRGLALQYERIEVAPSALAEALAALHAAGCRGVNVTLPHKEAAALLAETPTARVKRTGAANTLWWDQEGRLHADNTDGRGLCRDLGHWGIDLRGARILILGAGGAAMGVMPDLLEAEPAVVQVWNRTAERAAALCARFEGGGTKIQTLDDGASVPQPFDLVINATSAGVQGSAPPVPANALGKATACYDMFYGTRPTAFMDACRRAGASRCRDGLGMLVEQAAVSFERWHGWQPETAPVLAALRPYPSES